MHPTDYQATEVAELADMAAQLLAVRTLKDRVVATEKAIKAELDAALPVGTKLAGKLAGEKLGSVWKTDPKPVAYVQSEDQFLGHLEHHHEDRFVTHVTIKDSDLGEVAAVLMDHGHDDLLTITHEPPDWLVRQEMARAEAGEDIPGVGLREKPAVVSARATKNADEIVERLIRDGVIDVATLALEVGK